MSPIQNLVLDEAIRLLGLGWTQKVAARNASGVDCIYDGPEACCFCLTGALARACHNLNQPVAAVAESFVPSLKKVLGKHPADWNDMPGRTKEDVIRCLSDLKAAK